MCTVAGFMLPKPVNAGRSIGATPTTAQTAIVRPGVHANLTPVPPPQPVPHPGTTATTPAPQPVPHPSKTPPVESSGLYIKLLYFL